MNMTTDSCRKYQCVADALELGRLNDGDNGLDPELLKQIYRHCRNEFCNRQLFVGNSTFSKRWIDLDSLEAKRLVEQVIALDEEENLKRAKGIARKNLLAVAWNDLLGIDDPPIVAEVKIHGKKWGIRFRSGESCLRGEEVLNEDLPPIPTVTRCSTESTDSTDIQSILAQGGLPNA